MNPNEAHKAYLEALRAFRALIDGTELVLRAPQGDATITITKSVRDALTPVLKDRIQEARQSVIESMNTAEAFTSNPAGKAELINSKFKPTRSVKSQ